MKTDIFEIQLRSNLVSSSPVSYKSIDDVASVHVNNQHGVVLAAVVLAQLGPNLYDQLVNLTVLLLSVVLHRSLYALRDAEIQKQSLTVPCFRNFTTLWK